MRGYRPPGVYRSILSPPATMLRRPTCLAVRDTIPTRRQRSVQPAPFPWSVPSSGGPEIRLDMHGDSHVTSTALLPFIGLPLERFNGIHIAGTLQPVQEAHHAGITPG